LTVIPESFTSKLIVYKYIYIAFHVPDFLTNKVPRHWLSFVEDCMNELSEIKPEKYEGGVSKGIKHGQGV